MELVEEGPAVAGSQESLPGEFGRAVKVVARPADAERVLLVDVSHLAWRSSYAYDLTTTDGRKSGHVYGSIRLLVSALQADLPQATWCPVFCYDGAGAKELRRQILPAYKGNRDDGRFNPVPEVKDTLLHVPGVHVELAGREGDDAIAWAAQRLSARVPVHILTSDRDMWALTADPRIKVYSPTLKREVTLDDVEAEYHTRDPARIYLAKSVFGDSSDKVPSVGTKKAPLPKKHVAAALNAARELTPAGFYDALDTLDATRCSLLSRAKLTANRDKVETNHQVVLPNLQGFGKEACRVVAASPEHQEAFVAALLRFECKNLLQYVPFLYGAEA